MEQYVPAEFIEVFHLQFLEQFGLKTPKLLYALKGGCNLRFFLKSIRYSQDIDIDIKTVAKETLANRVRKIFESPAMVRFLQMHGVKILSVSEPKQTETTQRWKLQLDVKNSAMPLNTKIEFSRRGLKEKILFEPIDKSISSKYQMKPIFACHYPAEVAFAQKISALIGRSETQARDVFDLFHLINLGCKSPSLSMQDKTKIEQHAFSLSFEEFKSQVVAYLPPEFSKQYQDEKVWELMVMQVIEEVQREDP